MRVFLIRSAGKIERDRDANRAWCPWFEAPASECAKRCVIQNLAANALFHRRADNKTASWIDSEVCNAAFP